MKKCDQNKYQIMFYYTPLTAIPYRNLLEEEKEKKNVLKLGKDRQYDSNKKGNAIYDYKRAVIRALKSITFDEGHTHSQLPHTSYTILYCLIIKLYLAILGSFSFCKHYFCSPNKFPRDSTNVVIVSHSRIFSVK